MPIVYVVQDPEGLIYVGSTTLTLDHRWRCHLHAAKGGAAQWICQSLRNHAYTGFRVKMVYQGNRDSCYRIEAFLVDLLDSFMNGLNMTPTGSVTGLRRTRTPAQIEKHRAALIGRPGVPHTEESRQKMSRSAHLSWQDPEIRERRRLSMIGKKKGTRT